MTQEEKEKFAGFILTAGLSRIGVQELEIGKELKIAYIEECAEIIRDNIVFQNLYLSVFDDISDPVEYRYLNTLYISLKIREEINFIFDFVFYYKLDKKVKYLKEVFGPSFSVRIYGLKENGDYIEKLGGRNDDLVNLNRRLLSFSYSSFRRKCFLSLPNDFILIHLKFLAFHLNRFFNANQNSFMYSEYHIQKLKERVNHFGCIYHADFNDQNEIDSLFFLFFFRNQLKFISQLYRGFMRNEPFNEWNSIFLDNTNLVQFISNHEDVSRFTNLPYEGPYGDLFINPVQFNGVQILNKENFFELFWS